MSETCQTRTRRLDVFLERAIKREVLNLAQTFGDPIVF